MKFVGLDVHSKHSNICILDEHGRKIKQQKIPGNWERMFAEVSRIDGPFSICYEASCGYGHLHDKLIRIAAKVVVAHPGQLRLIYRSKQKNDRADAEKLAMLLQLDMVPTVYVPPADVREWRGMVEHRARLVGKRTRTKNGIRALLRAHGIKTPTGLWNAEGRTWLSAQKLPQSYDQIRLDMLLDELAYFDRQIDRVEALLNDRGNRDPGVMLLRTIPGIGGRTAEAMVAYIGDPHRFKNINAIGSYIGFTPCQDQSGNRNRLGHITGDGPATLRRLLAEAAWQGVRCSKTIKAFFDRLTRGEADRRKLAIVGTAHYLSRVMLAMLKSGEVWHERVAT